MNRRLPLLGALVFGALVLTADAQHAYAAPPAKPMRSSPFDEEGAGRRSLVELTGVAYAVELLSEGGIDERLRGVERLGRTGGREALEALGDALAGGPILSDPRTRLLAARVLARHALCEEGRSALLSIVGHPTEEDASHALGVLARDVAVFALARAAAGKADRPPPLPASRDDGSGASPEERALTPLVAAVITGSPLGDLAERALVLLPPADLGAFLRGVATATAPEVRLLGQLGDLRALPMLRRSVSREDAAVALEAVLALARLGDHTALSFARKRLAESTLPPLARLPAVEALLTLGAPDAQAALLLLFGNDLTREAALGLAERWPSSAVLPALAAFVDGTATHPQKLRAIELAGHIGGDAAVILLGKYLGSGDLAATAMVALATVPGPAAHGLLLRTLDAAKGDARRLVLRAWLVRSTAFGEPPSKVLGEFERAFASVEPADRALGAYALTLLGRIPVTQTLAKAEPVVAMAVLSAAASLGSRAIAELAPLARRALERGPRFAMVVRDESERIDEAALALALLAVPELGSSAAIAAWAESGGVASPQAAYRLAARDPLPFRGRLDALLAGTSPLVRVHAALGLGESPAADAAVRLAMAYRLETEPEVRRAVVRALSRRRESVRVAVLEQAATLDPDNDVRALAAAALTGTRHAIELSGGGAWSWLPLVPARATEPGVVRGAAVWHLRSSGLAITTLSPPDGVVMAFGQFVGSRVAASR